VAAVVMRQVAISTESAEFGPDSVHSFIRCLDNGCAGVAVLENLLLAQNVAEPFLTGSPSSKLETAMAQSVLMSWIVQSLLQAKLVYVQARESHSPRGRR